MNTSTTTATIRQTLTQRSTNTTADLAIIHSTEPVTCCGEVVWSATDRLSANDATGAGNWQMFGHRQCGNCGALVGPRREALIVNPAPVDIAEAEHQVGTEYGKWTMKWDTRDGRFPADDQ